MAKGRSLTISRSERLLGSSYSYGHSHGQGTVTDVSELGEDDVWSMVNGDDYSPNYSRGEWSPRSTSESNGSASSSSRRRSTPGDDGGGHVGGLSLAFEDSGNTSSGRILHQFRGQEGVAASQRGRHVASSAPVNVPDWTKIYRVDSIESLPDSDDGADDQNSDMIPPHEYLAREYARSRNSAANSVFEGVGRTLKGRDMSRVRDAVWSQTGFYG